MFDTYKYCRTFFQLQKAKSAVTPRINIDDKETARITASQPLDHEGCLLFRSATMHAASPAVDRLDISEAVKVLSQAMSAPREGHLATLKRLVRYLTGTPRMAMCMESRMLMTRG